MTDTEPVTVISTKRPKKRINYALAATLLAQHLTLEQAAKQTGAKDAHSLRVGLARRGVTATRARNSDAQIERAVIVATKTVSEASSRLREEFSDLLATHTAKLKQVAPKANLKHLKRVVDVMEPFARTAKIVHNWGDEQAGGIVVMGQMMQNDSQPEQPTIEAQSEVITPEQPAN